MEGRILSSALRTNLRVELAREVEDSELLHFLEVLSDPLLSGLLVLRDGLGLGGGLRSLLIITVVGACRGLESSRTPSHGRHFCGLRKSGRVLELSVTVTVTVMMEVLGGKEKHQGAGIGLAWLAANNGRVSHPKVLLCVF